MGISRLTARLLTRVAKEGTIRTLLTFGKQDADPTMLRQAIEQEGLEGSAVSNASTFYEYLGLTVDELDISEFEGANIIHNLNSTPVQLGQWDCIFDAGTLEHIFHVPNALSFINSNLKVGGLVIHNIPSHNHVDHGFYMFSPTMLNDYYLENNYEIEQHFLYEYVLGKEKKTTRLYHYHPGEIDHLSIGGWGKKAVGIWFVARKTTDSRATSDITQSFYKKAHNPIPRHPHLSANSSSRQWRSIVRGIPLLGKILLRTKIAYANYRNRRPRNYTLL